MTTKKKLGGLVADQRPNDPAVKLPVDVQVTIARGETAFKKQNRYKDQRIAARSNSVPSIITSVTDQSVQDRRETNLDAREQSTKAKRRQPPMTDRLRAVMIVVDRLVSDGVPLRVGPNSRMNKAIREWLNDKAKRSPDTRKSRHKEITPTGIRALLKQVRAEGQSAPRRKFRSKQTTQEVARELLKKLRANRPPSTD